MSAARAVVVVAGRVQGVGYRWFARRTAEAAGLSGWARNRPDGRVEVVLEGPAAAVADAVRALSGPDAPGRVSGAEVREEPPTGVTGFTTA